MGKLKLERLRVESFQTTAGEAEAGRGTVHGNAPCTHWASCPCNTGRYVCGTAPFTAWSCDYTIAAPC